ncbi:zinc finger CCCH domain-containing protein 13-like isoform X2 [Ruditapes philippinarum]|uniref:zinc finger CCCH domain-containing protein 13-like isoform X2 n=1 Tax=Ruditapes philippinarum TaxID=129788 RepID=UPI00295A8868|nr:zinc finger CCCH domain-containing protein 13-like isoform X2 [Ruditapes philippinarum]
MSMSYSSRTTPRSSASQGRIKTENTALSAILREKSNGNLAHAQRTAHLDDDQDTYRDRQQEPEGIEPHRSDLADDLKVPYPFDTQAFQGEDSARDPKPPSPPVQTTPPPVKEPATSLRSNSSVYAVANPEVLRAQGIEPQSENNYINRQHSNSNARNSVQSGVKFDSNSQRPPSLSNRTYGGSPVKDRAPTPYAKSPEQDLPTTPPDWDNGRERKSREQSNTSKHSLPPQHPPLDTLHSKPGSRGTKRTQDDNQSIKRVYVESPSFTKEEEEEYRFVSSRLEENDNKETFREMDNSRRGYGGDDNPGNSYSESRSRPKESNNRGDSYRDNRKPGSDYDNQNRGYDKDRYEDRNEDRYDKRNQDRNGEESDRDRFDDRRQERNGYSNDRNSRDRHRESDRYREKMNYDRGDRYERLRDERGEYEREPRREDEMEYRRGYKKQNTEMDERDLQKEAEYQKDLKRRIEKQSIKMKGDEKERYEKERYEREMYEREQYEKERERFDRESYDKENDFPRDSLEYPSDDREGGYVQDSLDFNYSQRQQEWENPPQNPYQDNPAYFPDGFSKQDSKPDFYDPDDVERMDIVNPKAPKVDYVEQNKYDYGKNQRKTYRNIVHKKKEEEEKLDHIFITPKLPSKPKKKHKKAQSAQPEHMGYQAPDNFPMGFKPSSAEEMWAQRAQMLSQKKGSAQSGKPAKASASKSVPRWNTNPQVKQANKFEAPAPLPNQGQFFKPTGAYNPGSAQDQGGYSQQPSGYSQQQGGYSTPTRQLQPLENRPAAPASTEMVPLAINPSSPFRRHMELKPISQEITTEDGQRISVDINLRLISPPPGHSGAGSPLQQQTQQLALLPVQETQGQYGTGVPYQMQDSYGNYNDGYNTGYQEDQGQQYNNGYGTDHVIDGNQYTAEELALVDPTSYSKKYQPGSVSFKDDLDNNSDLKSLEEGYASLYHKMKSKDPSEHPWYKIYNLHDYKKMQREVRLNRGTLGPDLDTESYKDKMEKRHKQFEYARMVMEKNRMELGHKKPPKFPRQPEKPGEEGVKRKTALEYAKNVPKPPVKQRPNQYNSYEVAAQITPGPSGNKARSPTRTKATPPPTQTMDVIDIRTLEQRHLQERQKTDKIRQNMNSVLSQQKAH